MPQSLQSNVVPSGGHGNGRTALPHASRHWLPVAVARRLITQHGVGLAGERALAQRERTVRIIDGARHVTNARRWIYWDVVLIAIERRTSVRFRDRAPVRTVGCTVGRTPSGAAA